MTGVWDVPEVDDSARLQRLRAHLEAAQRIAGLGTWEVELPEGTMRWSTDLDAILGWDPATDGGYERLLAVVHPDDRARVAQAHAAAVRDGTGYVVEHRIRRAGAVRHLRQEAVVEHDGGRPVRLIGTVQDVTERTARTRRLVELESRRRELLHRLVRASEDARSQLAADLHDGPVQVITATAMRFEVLARADGPTPRWVEEGLPIVREVGTQLRDVLFDLHPQVTGSGIRDAIEHLGSTVLPGTPVAVRLHGDEPPRDVARAVHGVVQEALWDVREHDTAEALTIDVVAQEPTSVVVDGGAGEAALLTRAGLLGVRERCEAAGGTAALDPDGRVLRCTVARQGTST